MSKRKADLLEQITAFSFSAGEAELKAAITVLSTAFKTRFPTGTKPSSTTPVTRRRSDKPDTPKAAPAAARTPAEQQPVAAGYQETHLKDGSGGK